MSRTQKDLSAAAAATDDCGAGDLSSGATLLFVSSVDTVECVHLLKIRTEGAGFDPAPAHEHIPLVLHRTLLRVLVAI